MTYIPVPFGLGAPVGGGYSFDQAYGLANSMVPSAPLVADDLAYALAQQIPGTSVVPYSPGSLAGQSLAPYAQRALPSGGPFIPGQAYPMGGGAPTGGAWAWGASSADDLAGQVAGRATGPATYQSGLGGFGQFGGNPWAGGTGTGSWGAAQSAPVAAGANVADDLAGQIAGAAGGAGGAAATASRIPGFAQRLFPYAPAVVKAGGPEAAAGLASASRLARFTRGGLGPGLAGLGVSMLGSSIKGNNPDVEGVDKNDVGSFLEGAGLAGGLGGSLALATAAGPPGWIAAGAAAVGYGLYKALSPGGKKGPDIAEAGIQLDGLISKAPAHLQDYLRQKLEFQLASAGEDKQLQAQVMATVGDEALTAMLQDATVGAQQGQAADLAAQIAERYGRYQNARQDGEARRTQALNEYMAGMVGRMKPEDQALFGPVLASGARAYEAQRQSLAAQSDQLPYQLALQLVQQPQYQMAAEQAGMGAVPMDQVSQLRELLTAG